MFYVCSFFRKAARRGERKTIMQINGKGGEIEEERGKRTIFFPRASALVPCDQLWLNRKIKDCSRSKTNQKRRSILNE